MKKFRVGVIGVGMGRNHVTGFNEHPAAEVVAVCDMDEARLTEIADLNNVPGRYTSSREMLRKENLDIVGIATPNKFHKPLAVEAFRAGCHVLCEKPMAMNAREARVMITAAEKAGKRLMINFSYRFTEQGIALKRQVDNGILGDVYFARTVWHRRRGMPGFGGWFGRKNLAGGGPLIDLGVHRLDLALWLMGYPEPVWVTGSTYNHLATAIAKKAGKKFDVEDLAVGMVTFANGATLEIEASWAANIAEKELMETRLLGTKGGLVHRNVNETYQFEAEIFVERDGAPFDMKLHPPLPKCHKAYYSFVESLLGKTPPAATGEEGLIVMELLDAIYKSAEAGRPIKIK
ncbi:MAG: Gfo/Idh/MocA family oxidoreductase [Planctomycetes bacterium]|nr:Gfo/Idh/MocA family oxidoreductase [Planctomycetota bacterium]